MFTCSRLDDNCDTTRTCVFMIIVATGYVYIYIGFVYTKYIIKLYPSNSNVDMFVSLLLLLLLSHHPNQLFISINSSPREEVIKLVGCPSVGICLDTGPSFFLKLHDNTSRSSAKAFMWFFDFRSWPENGVTVGHSGFVKSVSYWSVFHLQASTCR